MPEAFGIWGGTISPKIILGTKRAVHSEFGFGAALTLGQRLQFAVLQVEALQAGQLPEAFGIWEQQLVRELFWNKVSDAQSS